MLSHFRAPLIGAARLSANRKPLPPKALLCCVALKQHKNSHRSLSTEAAPEPSFFVSTWQALSSSTPVVYMQDALVSVHDCTGLPWWGSIVLSTVLFRAAITLPLAIYQQKIAARLELLTLEMPGIAKELHREASIAKQQFNWTDQQTSRVYKHSVNIPFQFSYYLRGSTSVTAKKK